MMCFHSDPISKVRQTDLDFCVVHGFYYFFLIWTWISLRFTNLLRKVFLSRFYVEMEAEKKNIFSCTFSTKILHLFQYEKVNWFIASMCSVLQLNNTWKMYNLYQA